MIRNWSLPSTTAIERRICLSSSEIIFKLKDILDAGLDEPLTGRLGCLDKVNPSFSRPSTFHFFMKIYKMKNICSTAPLPQTIEDLKEQIRLAIATVTAPLLQIMWAHLRLDVTGVRKGLHFEHMNYEF